MPQYSFYCAPKKHLTERYASMSRIPKWVKCEKCGKRAKLGMSLTLGQFVRNAQINDKTKRHLRWAFGKKKASKMRTTGDVDAALYDFQGRYKHLMPGFKRGESYDMNSPADRKRLGLPSANLSDPFPDTHISDDGRNNPERSER